MPATARVRILDEEHLIRAIGIEITNVCPNDCPYCPRATVMERAPAAMTRETARGIAESVCPSSQTWAELGLGGDPSAHPALLDAIAGLVDGGFRRVHVYSSLNCGRDVVERIACARKLKDSNGNRIEFLVTTSPHLWQVYNGVIERIPDRRFFRWGEHVNLLRASGVHVAVVGPVPWSSEIGPVRKLVSERIGMPEAEIDIRLGTDLFGLYGLTPRCEVSSPRHCPVGFPTITVEGRLSMCCHDLKPAVTFGSVLESGFSTCYAAKLALLGTMRKGVNWPQTCTRCASKESLLEQFDLGFWQ